MKRLYLKQSRGITLKDDKTIVECATVNSSLQYRQQNTTSTFRRDSTHHNVLKHLDLQLLTEKTTIGKDALANSRECYARCICATSAI